MSLKGFMSVPPLGSRPDINILQPEDSSESNKESYGRALVPSGFDLSFVFASCSFCNYRLTICFYRLGTCNFKLTSC